MAVSTHALSLRAMIKLIEELFAGECCIRTYFFIYCPGCGGSRAAIALLRGDIAQSLKYNPLTLMLVVAIVLMTLLDITKHMSNGKITFSKFRRIFNVTLLVFAAVYFVLRNYLWLAYGIDLLGDFS